MGLDIFIRRQKKEKKEDELSTELAYFRKVNFLVAFMENYGEIENCKDFPLTKEIVQELHDRCDEVLKAKDSENFENIAKKLLPTCDGFFFGSDRYDDWYIEDVKEVKEKTEKLLKEFDNLKENEEIVFHIWY